MGGSDRRRDGLVQRVGMRGLRQAAGRAADEPLRPEDWEASWRYHGTRSNRAWKAFLLALPSSPRCGICGAPFAGLGRRLLRPLGYRRSRKNPNVCAVCVELSPPGGMKMTIGVLFADLRGFTARFDGGDPEEASQVLRRFYRCAEDVLFPDAIIDKLIGDQVMAIYVPELNPAFKTPEVPAVMVQHALGLLGAVGYGGPGEPFVEVGIGLDFGEAFVGNIGQRALYDFTAVGDVVNTASRLQGQAAGGEVVLSERVANHVPGVGQRVELTLKGKTRPETAYRLSGAGSAVGEH